jgi:two-component system, response regulator RegA
MNATATAPRESPATTAPSVLIIDDNRVFSSRLGDSFRSLLWSVRLASDYGAAQAACAAGGPRLIVSEIKIGAQWVFEHLAALRALSPGSRFAIATAYPSVATAVRATRLGADGYFSRPVQAGDIVRAVFDDVDGEGGLAAPGWPSLNRTIWEYLNQVFVAAGTMSEAARRLGIDRRSLRRMLARYPPVR